MALKELGRNVNLKSDLRQREYLDRIGQKEQKNTIKDLIKPLLVSKLSIPKKSTQPKQNLRVNRVKLDPIQIDHSISPPR